MKNIIIGDAVTLTIPLRHAKQPFIPAGLYLLIFTAKLDPEDLDVNAVIQKTSSAGITESGDDAVIEFVTWDTGGREADPDALPEPITAIPALDADITLYCDIIAQEIADPSNVFMVARFNLKTERRITRTPEASIEIYTAGPTSGGMSASVVHNATEKTPLVNADEFGFWDSVSTGWRKITWANIKATLRTYLDPVYAPFVLNNYSAVVAPAITDDSGDGYAVGSLWIDTVTNEAYRCVDASVGAAVWIESTLDAAEVQALITAYAEPIKGADDNYVTDAEKVNIGNLDTAAYQPSTAFATAEHGSSHGWGGSDPLEPADINAEELGNKTSTLTNSTTEYPSGRAVVDALAYKVNNSDIGTAAEYDTGDVEGSVPVLGAGGKLPASLLEVGTAAAEDVEYFATAAQGTDSREWTAATVSEVEVQEGIATTRRAWTAERVRQSILHHAGGLIDDAQIVSNQYTDAQIAALGTLATQDGTFSGTSSGTNTGDETGARVATLVTAATAKTVLVDADVLPITDSEASHGFKKSTLTSLWTWAKAKIEAATLTISGAWAYSTRPTCSAGGTPGSTDLITLGDNQIEDFLAVNQSRTISVFTGSNSGTTGAFNNRSGSVATGWGRFIITSNINGYAPSGSTIPRSNLPMAFAIHGAFVSASSSTTARIRFTVGDAGSGTPPNAATDPLAARGFGFEIYWSTGNSRMEIRSFAHDGTAITYGSPVAFPYNYSYERTLAVSSDGAGTIRLYASTPLRNLDGPHTRAELIQTISGGPTGSSNSFAGNTAAFLCVNDGTNVPSWDAFIGSISYAKILLGNTTI